MLRGVVYPPLVFLDPFQSGGEHLLFIALNTVSEPLPDQ